MKQILAGALALAVLAGGAASAQDYGPYQGQPNPYPEQPGYGYDRNQEPSNRNYDDQRPGYDRGQDRAYNRGDESRDRYDGRQDWRGRYDGRGGYRYGHRHLRRVCGWRYHHRVCRWVR